MKLIQYLVLNYPVFDGDYAIRDNYDGSMCIEVIRLLADY